MCAGSSNSRLMKELFSIPKESPREIDQPADTEARSFGVRRHVAAFKSADMSAHSKVLLPKASS